MKFVIFNQYYSKLKDENLHVFTFSKLEGKIYAIKLSTIKESLNVDWIFHENNDIDLGLIPFGADPKLSDNLKITNNLFSKMEELSELDDVFYLSFQPGITIKNSINPIIRKGMVSRINEDKTYFIDGFAFPGNSGSPVFFKPRNFKLTEKGLVLGVDPLNYHFVGIIGGFLPYKDPAVSVQTGRTRVIFEENTGLSKVWSVDYLNEIIESSQFKEQIEKLKALLKTREQQK